MGRGKGEKYAAHMADLKEGTFFSPQEELVRGTNAGTALCTLLQLFLYLKRQAQVSRQTG